MEFTDIVRKRRMVRHFTADPVAMEPIERIVSLAQRAPSAGFTQGQSFIVVTNADLKKKIASLCNEEEYAEAGYHPVVSGAPVLVIPCTSESAYHRRYQEADKLDDAGAEMSWPVPYWFMDSGCSVMLLLLVIVNEGLAASFAGVITNYSNCYQMRTIVVIQYLSVLLTVPPASSTLVLGWIRFPGKIAPGVKTSVVLLAPFASLMDSMRSTFSERQSRTSNPDSLWPRDRGHRSLARAACCTHNG
jgi:hypothetical protein